MIGAGNAATFLAIDGDGSVAFLFVVTHRVSV